MIIPTNVLFVGNLFYYHVTPLFTSQKSQEKTSRLVHLRKGKHLLSQVLKRCSDVIYILVVDE